MLSKADAALVVNDVPKRIDRPDTYILDLVEEWCDLTDLPYVHGFWVGREEELTDQEAKALYTAKTSGLLLETQIFQSIAHQHTISSDHMREYALSFSYEFGQKEEESLAEYIQYAYFHGVIGDVPEIRFFDFNPADPSQN
jgi:predicted solute-binding protein